MKALAIIGAQKSGTATLTADLSLCEELHVDMRRKEESPLIRLGNGPFSALRLRRWFSRAGHGRVVVDVSTRYMMAPLEHVPIAQARRVLPELKVVCVLRDPIRRTLSHWQHDQLLGLATGSPSIGITVTSPYVLNSLYGSQLAPWVAGLGPENVLLLRFEDYIDDRVATIETICRFVGISSRGVERLDENQVQNVTAARARYPDWIGSVSRMATYRTYVRRVIPDALRDRIKHKVRQDNLTKLPTLEHGQEKILKTLYKLDNEALSMMKESAPRWDWMDR